MEPEGKSESCKGKGRTMARTIHLNEGFFGRSIGTIDDSGAIKLPDGIWGERIIGHIRKDGVYIPDGIYGERKVIDISPLGHMYLTEDAGLFCHGTWLGSIDADSRVFDTDRRAVAELRKGIGDSGDVIDEITGVSGGGETGGKPRPAGPGIPVPLLAVGGAVLALGAMWAIVSHTPALFTSASIGWLSKLGVAVTLLLTAIAVFVVSAASEQGLLSTLADCLGAGTFVAILAFGAYTLIFDPPTGPENWILVVLFLPIICACWAVAASVIVGLPVYVIKAVRRIARGES